MFKKAIRSIVSLFLFPAALLLMGASLAPEAPPWTLEGVSVPCEIVGDTVAGTLAGGAEASHGYSLEAGTYTVAAWAGWDIVSLSLEVRNSVGQAMARDDGQGNMPVVTFTLSAAEAVTVALTAGAARVAGVDADYAVVIAKGSGCFDLPSSSAKTILDDWTQVVQDEGYEIEYWEAVELSGEDMYAVERGLPSGIYAVVAETTAIQDDIDMYIRQGPDTVLTQNEMPDNSPVCHFELESTADISIQVDPWHYSMGNSTGLILLVARQIRSD